MTRPNILLMVGFILLWPTPSQARQGAVRPLPRREAAGEGVPAMASSAAAAQVKAADLPAGVRTAVLDAIARTPEADRWGGEVGSLSFGLFARALPGGEVQARATPPVLNAVQMLAVEELLLTRAILSTFSEAGLSDTPALRQAVARAAPELNLVGRVKGLTYQSQPRGRFAVAYVVGTTTGLTARLQQPPELAAVRRAYRGVMSRRMREGMKRGAWKEALAVYEHLQGRDLLSPEVSLAAARCFHALKNPAEVVRTLQQAHSRFAGSLSEEWLEECGDLALGQGRDGEELARTSYEKASKLLENTRSGAPTTP